MILTASPNDEGRYIFDYVDPATYTLAVELPGFKKTIQQNILVQQRGDVTVDIKLEVGEVTESLTVEASPVSLQFNTASRDCRRNSRIPAPEKQAVCLRCLREDRKHPGESGNPHASDGSRAAG